MAQSSFDRQVTHGMDKGLGTREGRAQLLLASTGYNGLHLEFGAEKTTSKFRLKFLFIQEQTWCET